MLINLSLKL